MPKQKSQEPLFFVRARKTGARKVEILSPPTVSFGAAAKKMWDAYYDGEVYDRAEVVMIKDGEERPRFTVSKKPPDQSFKR